MVFTRSLINAEVERAMQIAEHFGFALPEYAYWSPDQWLEVGADYDEVRQCMLGWDVTDFGSGNYCKIGRTLFTLRNGRNDDARYTKSYAEKLLINPVGQQAPPHYHRNKREDIICRSPGVIAVRLRATDDKGQPSEKMFNISVDGRQFRLKPDETIYLKDGQSVMIPPRTIHEFWCEQGAGFEADGVGYAISTEISSVCDDWNDNVFLVDGAERFPQIKEDEPARHVLVHEYPKAATRIADTARHLKQGPARSKASPSRP